MNLFKILALTFAILSGNQLQAEHHQVTVFIHGTSQAGLALLNFRRTWNDCFTGISWYERTLTKSRNDPFLEKSDLMLGMGLVDATELIQLPADDPAVRHKAAVHIIRAYDAITQAVSNSTDKRHYYTFGWLGLMSESSREQAAEQLYDALHTIKKEYTNRSDTVTFTLCSHSHGGQIVLHLAQIRKERGDTDFMIDQAILSATPMYYKNARHAASGMFKVIMNIHSEGDTIQVGDCFSTPEHRCCRTFEQVGMPLPSGNTPSPHILDVRLRACDRTDIFGHACFFILDRYLVFNYVPRKQRKEIRALLKQIHPLPLIALYPAIVPAMIAQIEASGTSGYQKIDCNFILDQQQQLTCEISDSMHKIVVQFPHEILEQASTQVTEAYADTHYQNEAQKALHSFKYIFEPVSKKKAMRKKAMRSRASVHAPS